MPNVAFLLSGKLMLHGCYPGFLGEDPRFLFEHIANAANLPFTSSAPEIAAGFPSSRVVSALYERVYIDVHRRWVRKRGLEPPQRFETQHGRTSER